MNVSKGNKVLLFILAFMAGFLIIAMFALVGDVGQALAKQPTASASKAGNATFQLKFKKKFVLIRNDLKSCSTAKIRRANKRLNRIQRQIPKLKINIQWSQGVSRWIAVYAQAVRDHGMGKKAKSKRMARKALKLYHKGHAYAMQHEENFGGPGSASSPNVSSMSYGLYQLIDGDYICGRGY